MSQGNQIFGEARSLMHQAPSKEAWREVLALVDRAVEQEVHRELLPYLLSHLEPWPDELRVSSAKLVARWGKTETPPEAMSLVRRLEIPRSKDLFLESWAKHPEALAQVTHATFKHVERTTAFETLWQDHLRSQIQGLALSNTADGDDFAALLLHEPPDSMRHLELGHANLTPWGFEHLRANKHLCELESLSLRLNQLGRMKTSMFEEAPWQDTLRSLDLSGELSMAHFFPGHVLEMGQKGVFANLHHLNISTCELRHHTTKFERTFWPHLESFQAMNNFLPAEGALHLLRSLPQDNLKRLNLGQNAITNEGLQQLYTREWPQLEQLHLYSNRLSSPGIDSLFSSRTLPALRHLYLSMNAIEAPCFVDTQQEVLNQLHTLSLSDTFFGDDNLYRLTRMLHEGCAMHTLNLTNTKLTSRGLSILATSALPQTLQDLTLSSNDLRGPSGVQALVTTAMPCLKRLRLSKCNLSSHDIIAITKATWFPQLEELELKKTPMDEGARMALWNSNLPMEVRLRHAPLEE